MGDISQFNPKGCNKPSHCRPPSTFQCKLGKCHIRPVGPEYHKRLQVGVQINSNPDHTPREGVTSILEKEQVMEEVQAMLKKGAVIKLPKQERGKGFYSSLFLVPRKGGGMRPVINLNEFIPFVHFKMEGMHTLRDILKENDWMVKVG